MPKTKTKQRDNKEAIIAESRRNGAEAGAEAAIQLLKDAVDDPRHFATAITRRIDAHKEMMAMLALGMEEFMREHDAGKHQVFPHTPDLHGAEMRCGAYPCQLKEMQRRAEAEKAELERLQLQLLKFQEA